MQSVNNELTNANLDCLDIRLDYGSWGIIKLSSRSEYFEYSSESNSEVTKLL